MTVLKHMNAARRVSLHGCRLQDLWYPISLCSPEQASTRTKTNCGPEDHWCGIGPGLKDVKQEIDACERAQATQPSPSLPTRKPHKQSLTAATLFSGNSPPNCCYYVQQHVAEGSTNVKRIEEGKQILQVSGQCSTCLRRGTSVGSADLDRSAKCWLLQPTRFPTYYVFFGADYYWELVTGHMSQCEDSPVAVHTQLGWVLSGPVPKMKQSKSSTSLLTTYTLYMWAQLWIARAHPPRGECWTHWPKFHTPFRQNVLQDTHTQAPNVWQLENRGCWELNGAWKLITSFLMPNPTPNSANKPSDEADSLRTRFGTSASYSENETSIRGMANLVRVQVIDLVSI